MRGGSFEDVSSITSSTSPTILEAASIPQTDMIDGIKQIPIEGVTMMYTWDNANAAAPRRHTAQYFEMLGNRAIYHEVAATTPVTLRWEPSTKTPPDMITGYNWELYNVNDDPTHSSDLASKLPEQMEVPFYAEVYNVLPLDNTTVAPRSSLTVGRTVFNYSGELMGRPNSVAPDIKNKS